MNGWLRAAGLSGFEDLVRQLSGEPVALCRANEIAPALLAEPDALIPIDSAAQLLDSR